MSPSVHHPSRSDSYPHHVLSTQYSSKAIPRSSHHSQYASIMHSHIHALPVELLSRIFLIGWQEDLEPDAIPTSQVTFETLVSHVCRRWRDVALQNPVLWTLIHFRTQPHMQRASVYLQRNRHHLIDIHVDTCAHDEHIPGFTLFREEFTPVFEIVTSHISRWRSLHLKVRDLACKASARSVLSSCGPAPHLETLHLWHIENWGTPERLYTAIGPPPVVVFDQELPMLKNIILTGVNLPWTHSSFLHNLTVVQFALHSDDVRMPYDLWRTMLMESPHLEKLSLHYSGPRFGTGDWPDDQIRLPGLKEVELTNMDPVYLLALFRRLDAPHVKQLRLELDLPDQDFTSFVQLLVDPTEGQEEETEEAAWGDSASVDANLDANQAPPADGDGGRGSSSSPSRSRRGPCFPSLDTLSVCALQCTPHSWKSLLQSSRKLVHFEADFARMSEGLFQTLFGVECSEPDGKGKAKEVPPHILLPQLHTIRLSGLTAAQVRTYIDFRHRHFQPSPDDALAPVASPIKWMLEQSQCDEEIDTWFAETGLYISEEERETRGWDLKERVEWFKGDDEEVDSESDLDELGEDDGDGSEDEDEDGE